MLNKCLKLVRFYKFKKDFIFANLLSKLAKEWLPPYVISKQHPEKNEIALR
jgi:hypothetical protein